jgi:hypothetical protein
VATNDAIYEAATASIFRITDNLFLANRRDGHAVTELDRAAASALRTVQGRKTLAEHARVAVGLGVCAEVDRALATLNALCALGFVQPVQEETNASPLRSVSPSSAIRTVAVITADRPALLRRCLTSIREVTTRFDETCRVLVIDGSRDERHRSANHIIVEDVLGDGPCHGRHVTPVDEVRAHAGILRGAASPSVIEAALSSGRVGGNRNLVSVLTAGERVLMLDDDIVCSGWLPDRLGEGIEVGGHVDPRQWEFLTSRQQAVSTARSASQSLLQAHGDLLGRSLEELSRDTTPLDFRSACSHVLGAIAEGLDPIVRVTMAGIAGDSGTYCPGRLLFATGPVSRLLATDAGAFNTAMSHREVRRTVPRTVLSHDSACMSYCIGVDNRDLLPPFMPDGRNEDGVFGRMLSFGDRRALMAHLPYGIVHDSERPPQYDAGFTLSARQTRISELLRHLTRLVSSTTVQTTPADRLRRLAQFLIDVSQQEQRHFEAFVREVILTFRCEELAQATRVAEGGHAPEHLRSAIREYAREFRAHCSNRDFVVATEFTVAGSDPCDGLRRMQRFIGDFGQLLLEWPDIWEQFRAVNTAA